jgi:hypothetical protein
MWIHGPYQTGKKTIVRGLLRSYGYNVVEPTIDDIDMHAPSGLMGKNAFIVHSSELGERNIPRVGRAPVIYFGDEPPNSRTKFEVIKLLTGIPTNEADRDTAVSHVDCARLLVNQRVPFAVKMMLRDRVDDQFQWAVHESLLASAASGSLDAIDAVSTSDVLTGDFRLCMACVYPIVHRCVTPHDIAYFDSPCDSRERQSTAIHGLFPESIEARSSPGQEGSPSTSLWQPRWESMRILRVHRPEF